MTMAGAGSHTTQEEHSTPRPDWGTIGYLLWVLGAKWLCFEK